jgi:hypothetical protein
MYALISINANLKSIFSDVYFTEISTFFFPSKSSLRNDRFGKEKTKLSFP